MVFHRKETDDAYGKEGYNNSQGYWRTYIVKQPIGQSACHTCHSVYLFVEYYRNIVKQVITDNTTGGTGYAAHYYCHPEGMSHDESFLYSGNIEQCQSEGIESEPCIVEAFQSFS